MDALPDGLPRPDADALAVSARLVETIADEVAAGGGAIPFDRYMELALYRPGLGYYSNGSRKFGAAGDFVTAPEVSDLFGRCVARSLAASLRSLANPQILELGAGRGLLAVDLLRELAALGVLPERYLILERSGELRARQRARFQADIPELAGRIEWLDSLPGAGFDGVVLGNEVVDAFPVKRFCYSGGAVVELGVGVRDGSLVEVALATPDRRLVDAVAPLADACAWPDGYTSEWSPTVEPWMVALGEKLRDGLLLLIDYGCGRAEFYHRQRATGTLMCHYRHRVHADPLVLTGLQDITAYVDFTQLAEAGARAGLRLHGYATQAFYLIDSGLQALVEACDGADRPHFLRRMSEVKTLTLPGEMGERFKAMAWCKGRVASPSGFSAQDLRSRL